MISQRSVQSQMARGNKASGDLIPWTVAQQFNDPEFATLSGARIVRIATHPGKLYPCPVRAKLYYVIVCHLSYIRLPRAKL